MNAPQHDEHPHLDPDPGSLRYVILGGIIVLVFTLLAIFAPGCTHTPAARKIPPCSKVTQENHSEIVWLSVGDQTGLEPGLLHEAMVRAAKQITRKSPFAGPKAALDIDTDTPKSIYCDPNIKKCRYRVPCQVWFCHRSPLKTTMPHELLP